MKASDKLDFIKKYKAGKAQIVQKELIADIETPISSLIKISKNEK